MSQTSFAISTTWNYNNQANIREMLSEIKATGFDAIEIGYNFTPQRLKELISLIDALGIKVVSVHNFCPLPSEAVLNRFPTDYYRLSALDEKEREKAVDYTKKSIDTACLVSCQGVVIHAGTVELEKEYTRALLRLYNEGKLETEEYQKAKEKLLADREAKRAAYLASVVRSLEEILSYACAAGVKIGLETRYYPNEIPDIQETEYLLGLFKDKGLVYWHDVGHAEANQRLRITAHHDYLTRFADCMLGIHLHDLKGIDDHRAPFSGDLDWSSIVPYMGDGKVLVIEAHPPATPLQIKEAIRRFSSEMNEAKS